MNYTILEDMNNCPDLKNYIDTIAEYRELEARLVNEEDTNFLGFDFDKIPSNYFTINYSWHGFLPRNLKIIYGVSKKNNVCSDDGMYFYVDSNDYLYEFVDYIKDKEIVNETHFILLVFRFINEYFSRKDLGFAPKRTEMYKYIYDYQGNIYKPITKHSITDFKYQGNAMCVERSVLAQNIFSFFGLESAIIYGTFSKSSDASESIHAFNVVSFDDEDYLIDINCMVKSFEIDSWDCTLYPFTDTLTQELMEKIVSGNEIYLKDYFMVKLNNKNYYYNNGITRKYLFKKCKNIESMGTIKD